MTTMLKEQYEERGRSFDDFYQTLGKLEDMTSYIDYLTGDLQIFTVMDYDGKNLYGCLHNSSDTTKTFTEEELKAAGATPQLINELVRESMFLFVLGKEIFFASKKVLITLTQRAGTSIGDFAVRNEPKIRFFRDAGYVAYMRVTSKPCKVMYREEEGAKKIFAIFSERYGAIPQKTIIGKIVDGFEQELGKAEMKSYIINNFFTEVLIEFPEKANDFSNVYNLPDKVVPGVRIRLSDTGESSFSINGTFRKGKSVSYIPEAKFNRDHTKRATIDSIMASVEKKIFPEYTKIPERLMKLITVDILDPASCILHVAEFCKLGSVLCKTRYGEMIQEMQASIAPMKYTAYDIAMMFLDQPEKQEGSFADVKKAEAMRSAFLESVFFDYEGYAI